VRGGWTKSFNLVYFIKILVKKKFSDLAGEVILVVKLTLRENESVQDAVRRFRKLVERSGIKKEMRRREFYEKPSEINRRIRLRAERRSRRLRNNPQG